MRFIKLALISIILLVGLVMAISLLLPSSVVVVRSVDINAPVHSISKKLSEVNEWKQWIANRDTLPLTVSIINGSRALIMGNTTMQIVTVAPLEIKTNWQVNKGNITTAYFNIVTHNNSPVVTVQWQFEQQLKWYPWEKFAAAISDKVLGPFMEQSLANLKTSIETSQQ